MAKAATSPISIFNLLDIRFQPYRIRFFSSARQPLYFPPANVAPAEAPREVERFDRLISVLPGFRDVLAERVAIREESADERFVHDDDSLRCRADLLTALAGHA